MYIQVQGVFRCVSVFPLYLMYMKVYQGVSAIHVYPGVYGCIHYICILYIQVCKGVSALNVYPGVGCIQVCQGVSTIFNVYPGILGCIRYICLSRCVRVYPLLLIHSGISPWTFLLVLLLYLVHLLLEYPYRSVIVGYLLPDVKVLE